jgi:hypothetical protein
MVQAVHTLEKREVQEIVSPVCRESVVYQADRCTGKGIGGEKVKPISTHI